MFIRHQVYSNSNVSFRVIQISSVTVWNILSFGYFLAYHSKFQTGKKTDHFPVLILGLLTQGS